MVRLDTPPKSTRSIFLARLAFIAWAFVLILAIISVTPVEWTHPYCNNTDSGPARAAFGVPLPFMARSAGLSDYEIMPHILLLNIVLLAALAYPFMGWTVRRLSAAGTLVGVLIAVPGVVLSLLGMVLLGFVLNASFAVMSIGSVYGDHYWQYRPLIMPVGHYDCMPSEFWFGPIKTPANLIK